MTAGRIIVDGDAIEIAGRFSSEAEIDAFIERVWTVFFALHPSAEEAESAEAPINLPPFGGARPSREVFTEPASANIATPSRPAVMAGPVPTIHQSTQQRPGVDAQHKAAQDAPSAPPRVEDDLSPGFPSGPGTAEDAAAFARLSAGERRAVLLMRKHRDRNAVAKIMEINPNSVTNYISAARNKGVVV